MDNATRKRTARSISTRIAALALDLRGLHVLTEGATGVYAVTPVLAAAAGARVTALTRASRHGSVDDVRRQVHELAAELQVADRIEIVESLSAAEIARADLVTNSGHLRPLDAAFVAKMKPGAAIALMYESWELRSTDVDVEACRAAGIRVGGTNEQHPAVGVFEYLGVLVLQALLQAGHALVDERALLVCDNAFGPFVRGTLEANGVRVRNSADGQDALAEDWDFVVIAATPPLSGGQPVRVAELRTSLFCQLWGDVEDRNNEARDGGVRWVPEQEPAAGHMGLKLEWLGPDPVTRLQAAGLKCGEVMLRGSEKFADVVQEVPLAPTSG